MTETPTLMEKNDCPKANNIVFEFKLVKSGYKKKFNPSATLSKVNDRIIKIINAIKSAGIIILLERSITCSTHLPTTTIVINKQRYNHITLIYDIRLKALTIKNYR